jgi:hypothetical protein
LNVGKRIKTVPEDILPDVVRNENQTRPRPDQTLMRPRPAKKNGDQFGSMGQRGPNNQGRSGGMIDMNVNYPNRRSRGMMRWAPMMVPPKPPPKLMELTLEELHKLENSLKPGSFKKVGGSEMRDQYPEEAITDVCKVLNVFLVSTNHSIF